MTEPPAPPPPGQPYYPQLPPSAWPYPLAVRQPQTNPLATAGMVLGICCCIFVAAGLAELAMCILAMTFGGMALGVERRHLGGLGKAKAGLILGIIGIVLYGLTGILSAGITLLI